MNCFPVSQETEEEWTFCENGVKFQRNYIFVKTLSSTFQDVDCDVCPVIGEHVGIIFVTQ